MPLKSKSVSFVHLVNAPHLQQHATHKSHQHPFTHYKRQDRHAPFIRDIQVSSLTQRCSPSRLRADLTSLTLSTQVEVHENACFPSNGLVSMQSLSPFHPSEDAFPSCNMASEAFHSGRCARRGEWIRGAIDHRLSSVLVITDALDSPLGQQNNTKPSDGSISLNEEHAAVSSTLPPFRTTSRTTIRTTMVRTRRCSLLHACFGLGGTHPRACKTAREQGHRPQASCARLV